MGEKQKYEFNAVTGTIRKEVPFTRPVKLPEDIAKMISDAKNCNENKSCIDCYWLNDFGEPSCLFNGMTKRLIEYVIKGE